jgi:beta-lactamase class A
VIASRLGVAAILVLAGAGPLASQSEKTDLLWRKLESRVAEIDAGFDGVMAVAIKDLTDGRTINLHSAEVMPTASMIKIAVLAELVRQGKLAESYTVAPGDFLAGDDILARLTPGTRLTWRDVAVLMVAVSDNSATNVLIDRLGMDRVNGLLDSLGLRSTRLRRRMLDLAAAKAGRENVATPAETVALLEAINGGRAFSRAQLPDFLKILGIHKEGYLNALLPDGSAIANKPGWLDGVRTDAALLLPAGRPFAVAVMTTFVGDPRAAERAIAEIGLLVWRHAERLGRSSEYGRDLPRN